MFKLAFIFVNFVTDGFREGDTKWGELGDGLHTATRYAQLVPCYIEN